MPSFANTPPFFYLLFLLCIAGLAASAPTTYHLNSPFPYGKLADKILNVNHVSYMIDDLDDDDRVRAYPENHSIPFSDLPIANFELPVIPINNNNTIPDVGTKNIFSFAYRIPNIIKKSLFKKWDSTLVSLRRMREFK